VYWNTSFLPLFNGIIWWQAELFVEVASASCGMVDPNVFDAVGIDRTAKSTPAGPSASA